MAGKKIDRTPRLPKSMTMISLIVAVGMLIVWAAGMYCLTAVTAEYAGARYYERFKNHAGNLTHHTLEYNRTLGFEEKYENYEANRMWEFASYGNKLSNTGYFTASFGDFPYLDRITPAPKLYGGFAVFDGDGNLVVSSSEDYFYFEYMNEEDWLNGRERSLQNRRVLFDRNKLTTDMKDWLEQHKSITAKAHAMRFTGYYDNAEFIPTLIEYIDRDEFQESVPWFEMAPVSTAVEKYGLAWKTMYIDTNTGADGSKLTTLYSDWFDVCYYQSSPDFKYLGKHYDNLAQLVNEIEPEMLMYHQPNSKEVLFSGTSMIIPSLYCCFDINGTTHYETDHQQYSSDGKTVHYYTLCVVYCSLWHMAAMELSSIYIVSFLLTTVLALTILLVIRRNIVKPVQIVGRALSGNDPQEYTTPYPSCKWSESYILVEGFKRHKQTIKKQKDEIIRLNTALEYAKAAEANRRRMVSDIAHELKTPLAVIHGYAEGLQEHIAEDKRDKYVSVILSESERTDRMVLEMLELSRLEAGRVKLQREEFSLTELTRAVFDRLDIQAREKGLKLEFEMPAKATVNADERRIAQVVENLATNAIKYTPEGGHIHVRIYSHNGRISFSIENDSEPLSRDQLKNVWEAFYRTDESRTGRSTGLGLAIVRNIIDLHGGRCIAMNTEKGVKFGFVI